MPFVSSCCKTDIKLKDNLYWLCGKCGQSCFIYEMKSTEPMPYSAKNPSPNISVIAPPISKIPDNDVLVLSKSKRMFDGGYCLSCE